MKINTPVATMGIRGTVGLFRTEPTVINSNLGHVWSVFLHEDIDGSHHLGRIAFIDQDPSSPTFGQVFYLLDSSEYIAYLEPQGPGSPPHVRLEPITNSKVFDDRHFYDNLGQILNAYQTGTVNPESVPGTPGSGDNPNLLFQQQFQETNSVIRCSTRLGRQAAPIHSRNSFRRVDQISRPSRSCRGRIQRRLRTGRHPTGPVRMGRSLRGRSTLFGTRQERKAGARRWRIGT